MAKVIELNGEEVLFESVEEFFKVVWLCVRSRCVSARHSLG